MATLNFPPNPVNGQIYPDNPINGQQTYAWDATYGIWRLVGVSSGVQPGTFGTPTAVAQIAVDVTGKVLSAQDVNIQLGSTTKIGLVRLTDNTTSNDPTTALSAAQGFELQSQIGDTSLLSPPAPDLVSAINSVASQTTNFSYVQLDDVSGFFNGVGTTFPLTLGGSAFVPNPQTNLMVFIGGVAQVPGDNYVVTGSSISFTSPPPALASFYATTIMAV